METFLGNSVMAHNPTPRKHHFLPQSYLQGFSDGGLKAKNGRLRVIDFGSGRCFTATSHNIAHIRDYYAFQNIQGERDFRVEIEILQKIDDNAAKVIREMEDNLALPTGEDWEALCVFVVFLDLRIPQFRQVSYEIAQHYVDLMTHIRLGTPEAFDAAKKRHEEQTGERIDLTYDEAKKDIQAGGFEVEVPRTNDIQMMLNLAPTIGTVVRRMTPHLLVARGKAHFITGDVPIHKYDTKDQRRELGIEGVGWATPEVEVSIPLTKRCCLVLNWSGAATILPAGDVAVANCNLHRANACFQYLFSEDSNFPILQRDLGIMWKEREILHRFFESKRNRPALEIAGGPIERRDPRRIRR